MSIKHLHRYTKKDIATKPGKSYVVFACNIPGCTHYLRADLAENKQCECNRCGNLMILDRRAMLLTKPHCSNCVERHTSPADKIKQLLEERQ